MQNTALAKAELDVHGQDVLEDDSTEDEEWENSELDQYIIAELQKTEKEVLEGKAKFYTMKEFKEIVKRKFNWTI